MSAAYEPDEAPVWVVTGNTLSPVLGQVLTGVHPRAACAPASCVVHNRSPHHMRPWPLHWRDDRGMFERICAHGIGHPDPDQRAHWAATMQPDDAAAEELHGCDGCCRAPT